MPLLHKLDLRFVLIVLILAWLASFPVKGVLFQLSLYLLPILVLSFRQTRLLLKYNSSIILLLSLCFVLPLFLSEFRSLIVNGGTLTKDPFEIFWRLVLFPLVLFAACDYSRFPIRWLQNSFVLFAVIYGTMGIIGLFFHISMNGRVLDWRAVGMISNSNPFGFLVIAAALICFQRLLLFVTKKELFIFLPGFLLLLVAGVLSGSRSALLGGVLSLVLLLILQRKSLLPFFVDKKKLLILSGSITLFFLLSWLLWHSHLSYIPARIVSVVNGDIRLQIWQHYLSFFSENPFFGSPLVTENRFYIPGADYGPHNMYISVLLRSGIVGLIGLLLGLGWLAKRIISSSCSDSPLLLALLLLLCTFCFFNAPLFGNEMTQGVFALIVAMTLCGESSARADLSPFS